MSGQQEEEPAIESPVLEHRSSFAVGPGESAIQDMNAAKGNPFEEEKKDRPPQDAIQEMFECRITNLVEFTNKKDQKQEKKKSEVLNDIVLYV